MERDAQQDLTLRDYLAPVLARKWLVLAIAVLITAAAYLYSSSKTKVYDASTKLYVGQEGNALIGAASGFSDERTVENQATLLTSTDVVSIVAKRIGFSGSASELASRVNAAPVSGADFIGISATGRTGKEAADIANGFARAFVDVRSADRRQQAQKALDQYRRQLKGLPNTSANAAARDDIESNIRQLQVVTSTGAGNARQVDPAVAPSHPTSPRPKRDTLLALPLALLVAVLIAYLLHRLDPRMRRVEEAAEVYDRPVIASINHDDTIEHFEDGRPALSDASKEPFRALRVALELSAVEGPLRTILVTSASEGEGKSTIARNLGLALVEAGHRVALVDADLRKSSLTRLLGVEATSGLAEALTGRAPLSEVLLTVEIGASTAPMMRSVNGHDAPPGGFTMLPAGQEPASPSAILSSSASRLLLDDLAEHHDVVVVDTPPLLAVSDTIPLLSWADGVVIVARTGVTDRRVARRASEIIDRAHGANLVGIVVNDLTASDVTAYGGYYGSYGSRSRSSTPAGSAR